MKGKLIKLNTEYAVQVTLRGPFRKCKPVRKALAVDRRSNGKIVVSYDAMVPTNLHEFTPDVVAAAIVGKKIKWKAGRRLDVLDSSAFIAPWDDWAPPGVQDGRPKAERPRSIVVGGVTYTEQGMAA